jgi:hypothetical protein
MIAVFALISGVKFGLESFVVKNSMKPGIMSNSLSPTNTCIELKIKERENEFIQSVYGSKGLSSAREI